MVKYYQKCALALLVLTSLLLVIGRCFPEYEPLMVFMGLFSVAFSGAMCICGLDEMEKVAARRIARETAHRTKGRSV